MLESKFNQNYGPEGLVLMGAAMATAMPGGIIAFVGLALLVVSRTEGALGVVAYCTVGIGMVAMALSMIRFQQAAEAGKRFRGDRPMQTGPGSH
jgi:hypothetical protein